MTTEIRQIVRPLDPQAVVEAHVKATTGVHGVGDSQVESKAGAQAKVDAHAGRTNNPHQVTATQVGAVSKAGDTMTGPLGINYSSQHVKFLESGTQKWHIESVGGVLKIVESGVAIRGVFNPGGGNFTWNGSTVWHAGNDGAGSGLDADMLDGHHASYFQPASDERLKADIQPLADALSKVLSLRGVRFVWNDKAQEVGAKRDTMAGREIGFLAGEVAQVVPEVVLDWIETPDGEKYKTVDSARLVALLVEAIKELNAKVDALEERVAALEGGTP